MKSKVFVIIMMFIGLHLPAREFLTIYNQNQALYNTSFDMDLKRGVHYYAFENIPTGIITESVIFLPKDRNVLMFSQNFEYDLANTHKMLQKYIDKDIKIYTEKETFEGTLIFNDFSNYGLLDNKTNKLNIINAGKVLNVHLPEMPQDFYTKPTLRWQLSANRDGKYPVELSYLTNGLNWRATYNAVLDKNTLALNSWVTINNNSGKDYRNVKLKLIAGSVQTHRQGMPLTGMKRAESFDAEMTMLAPAFEERAFSDYRIYTLDALADIDNNQEKQLTLYPVKQVKYNRIYEYIVQREDVDVIINFKNSKSDGLGLPLPMGNINFYEIDEKDNTQQFVGVSSIRHTSLNQDVKVQIGKAFDIVATTKVTDSKNLGRVREVSYEITLVNNKAENVSVDVIRQIFASNVEIIKTDTDYVKRDAFNYLFKVNIAAGKTRTITFTERQGS